MAGSPTATQQHHLLALYYPNVRTLRDYILEQLPARSKARRRKIATLGQKQPRAGKRGSFGVEPHQPTQERWVLSEDAEKRLLRLLDKTLVGYGQPLLSETESEAARARDRLHFSQHVSSTAACTAGESSISQSDVS